jgi:hypothetical protein
MKLAETTQIVSAIVPVDLQTAQDGDWVSLKDYNHVTIVFHKGAGTAGDDPTVRVQQAQDNSGTGAKDLTYSEYWIKQGTLTGVGQFTKTTQSAAASTALNATSAEEQVVLLIEFDADMLDVDNGFDHIRFRVDDVGTNAQLGSALYILSEPRYAQATPPSAL